MKPFHGIVGVCLIGWLTAGAGTAGAAWDNVFQVCCHSCNTPAPVQSYYAPPRVAVAMAAPVDDCCPRQTISYRQRCYYQPVTSYKMQTRLEPVTSYRTSYYYEPVTSYRYTTYRDPCTGCCRRVACPTTSYRLRSQCNAVVSYVQRCEMVPVTSYKRTCCYEPVVTQCPDPCAEAGVAAVPAPAPVPGISEVPRSIPPVIDENQGGAGFNGDTLDPQNLPLNSGSFRAPAATPEPPRSIPPVKLERIASNAGPRLQGRVVAPDRATPKSNAKIIFVSAAKMDVRENAVADESGQFDLELSQGEWLMYLADGSGKATYHSRIQLRPTDHRLVTVVSR